MPVNQDVLLGGWSLGGPAGMTVTVTQTWTYGAGVDGHDEGDPVDLSDGVTIYIGGSATDLDDFTGATAITATIDGNVATLELPVPSDKDHEVLRTALGSVTKTIGKLRPKRRGGDADTSVEVLLGETAAVAIQVLGTAVAVGVVTQDELDAETAARTAGDTAARARSNHTGVQAIATVTGLQAALDAKETPAGAQTKVDTAITAEVARANGTYSTADVLVDDTRELALTKHAGNPVVEAADLSYSGAYWPSVLRVDVLLGAPIDAFYCWYSTDHAVAGGGIALMTAPSPLGPWTDQGQVWEDNVAGSQTETPSVVWNENTSLFHMYYSQSGVGTNQSTLLATSPDGETWTRIGLVIDVPGTDEVTGTGHTGYVRVQRLGHLWFGYHLLGGTNFAVGGISYSYDGLTWQTDPRHLGHRTDLTGDIDRKLSWNGSRVVRIRGQLWWVGRQAPFTSGGPSGAQKDIVCAPIADDLRTILAPPRVLIAGDSDSSWKNDDIRSLDVIVENGRLYVFYGDGTDLGVATAEVL